MDPMSSCCCCLLRLPETEKDLKTPYIRQGATEIFADMLEECFQIQLAVNGEGWGVCEKCVGRLRDASDFKLQVKRSQAELQARLDLDHVKLEVEFESKISHYQEGCVFDSEETVIPNFEPPVPESAQLGSSTEQLAGSNTKLYETVHQCQICQATFTQESNLTAHMQTHNLATQPTEVCNTFEKQFSIFCSSNRYQQPKTPACVQPGVPTQHQQPKTAKQVQGTYTCRICCVVFDSRKLLAEHQRIHKKKIEHSCEICSKKFKRKYKMIEHVRTHTGLKPYSCELCNKSFTVKSSLIDHNRIHTGDVFICDVCNKQYIRKHELVLHLKVHNGLKYECDVCNKQFNHRANRHRHRLTHSDQKPYSCDACGKRFKRKDHLNGHRVEHLGHKPYSCEIYDQKFTTKAHVKKHKMKLHAQNV